MVSMDIEKAFELYKITKNTETVVAMEALETAQEIKKKYFMDESNFEVAVLILLSRIGSK